MELTALRERAASQRRKRGGARAGKQDRAACDENKGGLEKWIDERL
jgi:hypothetical protein